MNDQELREKMWIGHGCPISALYGDDGERQCGKCLIDFKRDDLQEIKERINWCGKCNSRCNPQNHAGWGPD